MLRGYFLLESGEEDAPGVVCHFHKWGVQLQELEPIVRAYPGTVHVRRITWLRTEAADELDARIAAAWLATHDATYDTNVFDLLRAKFGWVFDAVEGRRTSEFVCSAYAAFVLCSVGALPQGIVWDSFSPRDFAAGGRIDELLAQTGVARLGPVENYF